MSNDAPPVTVIEIVGEGKTDAVAVEDTVPVPPTAGVLTVLAHRLCDSPTSMRVLRRPFRTLRGKNLPQKVQFFKRNARINGSAGCVFVMDTEGDQKRVLGDLTKGRDSEAANFPMAIGVAHPCIEAWLLSDATAIKRGLNIAKPTVPSNPESLPAPCRDRKNNPKESLKVACGCETNSQQKTAIANYLDFSTAETVCPSLKAFADEVCVYLRPLYCSSLDGTAIVPDNSELSATRNERLSGSVIQK